MVQRDDIASGNTLNDLHSGGLLALARASALRLHVAVLRTGLACSFIAIPVRIRRCHIIFDAF